VDLGVSRRLKPPEIVSITAPKGEQWLKPPPSVLAVANVLNTNVMLFALPCASLRFLALPCAFLAL